METKNIPLVVIAGPTAVGKTALSIEIAKKFNGEIINGDSLQFYKGLDIGTAKIKEKEMDGVTHHLFDTLKPWDNYNASQFRDDAHPLIVDIFSRGKLPIIVGGTGLYLEGLLYNLEFGYDSDDNQKVRQELDKLAKEIGAQALWNILNEKDPQAADKIPFQNVRRTIRALEVIEISGEKFSSQKAHKEKESVYDECLIVLDRPRAQLYERINQRVYLMIEEGLEKEAFNLFEESKGQEWQSVKGIGYKEWWPYFKGYLSKEEVINDIQQNSRRYAKRQLTWLRNRMKEPQWIEITQEDEAIIKALCIVDRHLNK
ncbi:tRNA (adenosine(37)-N6)-dimethylallyltransferase MiaA [Aerococcaceae bacterium WGS1372]